MTKAKQLQAAREAHPSYHITGVKTMTQEQIDAYEKYSSKSLDELYTKPSDAKQASYSEILLTYEPRTIHAVQGSAHSYSVLLTTRDGVTMHITKANNYLVTVTK